MNTSVKKVLVTGGAGGIGAATAARLANQGCEVVIADSDIEKASRLAEQLPRARAEFVDVAKQDSVAELFRSLRQSWERLDGYVHAPGIGVTKHFLDIERREWDAILDVNLNGAFYCLQQAGRWMASQGSGAMVAISSVAGQKPSSKTVPYAATKSALELLVKGLAMELGRVGVRVNTVAPGATDTPLVQELHKGGRRDAFTKRIPMSRYAQPEEIAAAAQFLVSDESSFVTGQVVYVDGGMSTANLLEEKSN
jgi:3-oxoacyl-[acyl-carrier protein] reductase